MERRTVLSLVLAAASAAGAVLLASPHRATRSARDASPPAVDATPVASSSPPPLSLADARTAATGAVARTGEVVEAGMFRRQDLIAEFATARFAPRLATQTAAQVNGFLLELGIRDGDTSGLSLTEVPVTATAEATASGARVQVWSVVVVVVPWATLAREVWRTVTVDLVADGGRWMVDGWSSSTGPAPSPLPNAAFADAVTVNARLAGDRVPAGGVG